MYSLEVTEMFEKQFKKLDRSVQQLVARWIRKHLKNCTDPKAMGKGLVGNYRGYWRYRIGGYRLITEIREQELMIVAISIAHRSDVYRK